jgi:G3E family GTPase
MAPAGTLSLEASENPDPSMTAVIFPASGSDEDALAAARDHAVGAFSAAPKTADSGTVLSADGSPHELLLTRSAMRWTVKIPTAGPLAIFTQHHPEELNMRFLAANGPLLPAVASAYKPDHTHDQAVTSVGIECVGDCDSKKLDAWLSKLLREQGADIFRMKGVFAVEGDPDRFIFQGVHMLLDSANGGPWGSKPRRNSLVFIGKNLDREALNGSFRTCLA